MVPNANRCGYSKSSPGPAGLAFAKSSKGLEAIDLGCGLNGATTMETLRLKNGAFVFSLDAEEKFVDRMKKKVEME